MLSLSAEGQFESKFFVFRRKVQQLERQLAHEIGAWLQRSPSLQAKLRIMELFQCSSRRETVRVSLTIAPFNEEGLFFKFLSRRLSWPHTTKL